MGWYPGKNVKEGWDKVTSNVQEFFDKTEWRGWDAWGPNNPPKTPQDQVKEGIGDIEKPTAPKAVDSDGDGLPDQVIDPDTGEVLQDFTAINDLIKEAQQTEFPTFDEWQAQNPDYQMRDVVGSEPYQQISTLADEMRAGPDEADIAASRDYAREQVASLLGVTPEEYEALSARLTEAVEGGPAAQQGFTPEQEQARERAQQVQIQEQERRAERMIENIQASTGSSTRAYMAADQQLRNIQNAELQADMAMAEDEYRRQEAQWAAKNQQWQQLMESGQMSQSQYLELLQQSKAEAFQGYAQQVNALFKQNDQYLQQYNTELQRVKMHVSNIYQAVNSEMGVQSAMAQSIKDKYDIRLSEYQLEVDELLTEYQMQQDEVAGRRENWSVVFDGLNAVTNAVGLVV